MGDPPEKQGGRESLLGKHRGSTAFVCWMGTQAWPGRHRAGTGTQSLSIGGLGLGSHLPSKKVSWRPHGLPSCQDSGAALSPIAGA